MNTLNYVLITGAGAGYGKALAFEVAKKGHHLLLVSLDEKELAATKNEILQQCPAIKISYIAIDLLLPDAHVKVYNWVKESDYKVSGLINNVGFGYVGKYESFKPSYFENMIQLNVTLTHNMCRIFFEELKQNNPSFIHNVASLAAFYAVPYKTVYVATKSFVIIYSRSLREELKLHGIRVSCSCPGPMITNETIRQRIEDSGWRKYLMSTSRPEDIARITVRRMFKGKGLIIPEYTGRIVLGISRLIPFSFLSRALGRVARNSFSTRELE